MMKSKVTLVLRLLLGFVFFASGITGLLQLAPMPTDLPADLMKFNEGMMAAKYFFPLVKGVESVCGLLLLSGFFVPLALVVLAPVMVNIFFVHAFLAPEGLIIATILGAIMIYLSFFAEPYSAKIKSLFKVK